ncbi:MAG: PIN domain-containing protein [Nitrospirae bacterium]|nr:PIN domain-containing protein [Nitrospirota bacterium]
MPSKKTRFAVLDTSVYIENFRTGRFAVQILKSPYVIRCSAVVLHELLRGARPGLERRFVIDLMNRCQIITPTETHWIQAAEILNAMRHRRHYGVQKLRELTADVLIALSARSIGACLITCNGEDFQAIRWHLAFQLLCWQ